MTRKFMRYTAIAAMAIAAQVTRISGAGEARCRAGPVRQRLQRGRGACGLSSSAPARCVQLAPAG
jgi:hypothetical protein